MGVFLEIPQFKVGRPGQVITCGPTVFLSDIAGEIVVPAQFETDWASIPKFVPRWLYDPLRHGRMAAVIHDYLVRKAKTYRDRVTGDKVFLEILLDTEEGWRARTMYAAVRLQSWRLKLKGKLK